MPGMGLAGRFRLFRTRCMAILARRFLLYVCFRHIYNTRAVQFLLLVTVKAGHPFLVMHVSLSAEISGKLGIYAPAMASCAGFPVILFDELMALEKSGCDPRYLWRSDMTLSAGSVAAAAGPLKHPGIEYLFFIIGETPRHACP